MSSVAFSQLTDEHFVIFLVTYYNNAGIRFFDTQCKMTAMEMT